MQKLIRSAFAILAGCMLFAAAPTQAQTFANSDLENWAMRNGTQAPVNWQTTDDLFATILGSPLPFTLGTCSRSNDRQNGTYSAKLETVHNMVLNDTLPGFLILGTRFGGQGIPGGMPFNTRPSTFQFHHKLSGATADSAQVIVALTRTVNGNQELIAVAESYLLVATANYTAVNMPLLYTSSAAPDSAHVIFISGTRDQLTPGTTLYLDNMRFNGMAAATRDAKLDAAVTVFPNPSASGSFTLSSTQPALLAAPFTVTDMTGRTVLRGEASSPARNRTLDLSRQSAGIYTLQLQTADGLVTRKLVIE